MLPVTAMCLLAGSVVLSHRTLAAQAAAVDHGVVELTEMVTLRDSLREQQAAETFEMRFGPLSGRTTGAARDLSVNLHGRVSAIRLEADHAIVSLGNSSPVSAENLRSLNAQDDAGLVTAAEAEQRFGSYIAVTETALIRGFHGIEAQTHRKSLVAAQESLREASALISAAIPQVTDLGALWFPAPGETAHATAHLLAHFEAENLAYATAHTQLRELDVPVVIASLDRIQADPRVQAFDQAVAATLLGKPLSDSGAAIDPQTESATFKGYFARDQLLDGLVTAVATEVRADARDVADTERARYVAWATGALALALTSVGLALLIARSISKPLTDLASYAHAVNEGLLDAQPPASREHGPRETEVVFGAFGDLVANLQLLDAKTNALAHLDFDDPVLRQPLPGRLGRSLESSVALLSGSIVERDQLQTHLAHAATHDALTGIRNRPDAITEIEAAMRRAARSGATTALLFVDLNEFKAVNDSHGHEVGDEVLRQVASRLLADLRGADFVARLGGDEFVVVAEEIADVVDATTLARRIIETLSVPFEIGHLRIRIGAAVGIAISLDGPEEPLRLLARGDAAMYRAKQHDGSAIEIFDAELQRQLIEREDIETALTAALTSPSGGGLHLQYQPVTDATSGELVGAEALIRWNRPGHGRLPPDSFIPIAEMTSLIVDVDCWVLAEATRQLAAWSSVVELAALPVSINISGRHLLSQRLPGHIRAVIAASGIDPHRMSIELTETVLLTDLVLVAAELDAVRALGVRVAIDDFGTGYTSLAHLQQLPIDTIKIDRSFICQLNAPRGKSLVRMVTDLGHAIDVNIVAEGVETAEEMHALQAIGADHIQGYLFSRPLDPDVLSAWAHERASARPPAALVT